MNDTNLPDSVLEKILEKANKKTTPEEFLSIFNAIKSNPVLARILSLGETELEDQIQKVTYASIILNDEMFAAIGEESITAPGMTLDKICTIGIGEPETIGLTDGGLTIEQVEAMTGEYLAHPGMTMEKITLLGFGATPEQIRNIGAENIANMPIEELTPLLMF